jgi:hypothetical protein
MYDNFVFLDFFLVSYLLLLILAGLLIYASIIRKSVRGSKKKDDYRKMEFGDDDKVYYVDFDFKKKK